MNYHKERLTPKLYPKRGKKKHRLSAFKDGLSPTKSCNLSSDEFKSDVEEDDKLKTKYLNSKSPKFNRKKSVSPKHCDKYISRCIVNECKSKIINLEDKSNFSKNLDSLVVKNEFKMSSDVISVVNNDSPLKIDNNNCKESSAAGSSSNFQENENLIKSKGINCSASNGVEIQPETIKKKLYDSFFTELEDSRLERNISTSQDTERSRSPPVLSIPETSNSSSFADSKPLLLLLENNSNESKNCADIIESKVVNGEKKIKINDDEDNVVKTRDFIIKEKDVKMKYLPWKIEEDRVILQTLQVQENCEETFLKIGKVIPSRSVEDIKKRFAELMNILYEMKAKTENGYQ